MSPPRTLFLPYVYTRIVPHANYHHSNIIYKIHTNRNTCMTCHTKSTWWILYALWCESLQGNSESTSQSKENRYRWVFGLDHELGKGQM